MEKYYGIEKYNAIKKYDVTKKYYVTVIYDVIITVRTRSLQDNWIDNQPFFWTSSYNLHLEL